MNKEVRFSAPVEVRAQDEASGTVRVEGYAMVYNERANIADMFEEVIAPGALDGRLGDDVTFLVNHRDLPLARTTSGTLALSLDAHGLRMSSELDLSDPDVARIVPKMKRGDLSKMSFSFEVDVDEWDQGGEIPLRTIKKIGRLWDVAIVTDPAYSGTEIALRNLQTQKDAAQAVADAALAQTVADDKARRARIIALTE